MKYFETGAFWREKGMECPIHDDRELAQEVYCNLREFGIYEDATISGLWCALSNQYDEKRELMDALSRSKYYLGCGVVRIPHTSSRTKSDQVVNDFAGYFDRLWTELERDRTHYEDPDFRNVGRCIVRILNRGQQYITNDGLDDYQKTILDTHNIKINDNMKLTRWINKIANAFGLATDAEWNRKFAAYADAITPLEVEDDIFVSVNLADYYKMSIGHHWASCHTIDKDNVLGNSSTYSGMYSGGCRSYAEDAVSMVVYTIPDNKMTVTPWREDKLRRQMFQFDAKSGVLIQNRMYPDGRDNSDYGKYTDWRKVVEDLIAEVYGLTNMWGKVVSDDDTPNQWCERHVNSCGYHYRDYNWCADTKVFGNRDDRYAGINYDDVRITIGANGTCPVCGGEADTEEHLFCSECGGGNYNVCTHCGRHISEDDTYWVGDDPYCGDCCTCCDHCDEYTVDETYPVYRRNRWSGDWEAETWCRYCVDNNATRCDRCGDLTDDNYINYSDEDEQDICEECATIRACDSCGQTFTSEPRRIVIHDIRTGRDRTDCLCPDCAPEEEEE